MHPQIEAYRKEREHFVSIVRKFPINKRLTPLFGDWSLREILLHLLGWSEHQNRVIAIFKRGGIPENIENEELYNREQIAERNTWDFDKALAAYLDSTDRLIRAYQSIPEDMTGLQIWLESSITPKSLLKIETEHLRNDHTPQLEAVLTPQ